MGLYSVSLKSKPAIMLAPQSRSPASVPDTQMALAPPNRAPYF